MKEEITKKQAKITANVIKAFKEQYNEEPVEYETIWPISSHDYLQTETRSFNVHLNFRTGKLIRFEEDK